jgi:SAM-dependent methyltransferase
VSPRIEDVHMDLEDWIREHAAPPARLLEVGCGDGELARNLAKAGYDVTAIDPEAPAGEIFRTTSLEDFTSSARFDVVVASRSLHHIGDISNALEKIHSLLVPGGLFLLNEFAWDQMDERTARWYLSQSTEHRHEDGSLLPGRFPDAWIEEHDGLHDSGTMRRALDERFDERTFNWVPYIAEHYLKRPKLIDQEEALISSDSISPLGFRYVGIAG